MALDIFTKDYIRDVKFKLDEVTTEDRQKSLDGIRKQIEHYEKQKKITKDRKKKADLGVKIADLQKDIAVILDSIKKDREKEKKEK